MNVQQIIDRNREAMRLFAKCINTNDLELGRKLIAETAAFKTPVSSTPLYGAEGYLSVVSLMRKRRLRVPRRGGEVRALHPLRQGPQGGAFRHAHPAGRGERDSHGEHPHGGRARARRHRDLQRRVRAARAGPLRDADRAGRARGATSSRRSATSWRPSSRAAS